MNQIRIGQGLLILCSLFYLAWWAVTFHPEKQGGYTTGISGILLFVTALLGLSGLAINLIGIRDNAAGGGFVPGWKILLGGILAYIFLMIISGRFLHRPVTTELLLIVGWTILEIASCNVAYGNDILSTRNAGILLVMITLAAVSSLVFYLAYYNVSPTLGYYFGMVPLVTEAVCMFAFVWMTWGH